MMNAIIKGFRAILKNSGKIFLTTSLISVFLFLLFPFRELNDLISNEVSKMTRDSVYVQFEDMHFNFSSLTLDNLLVETPMISTLRVDKLSLAPSLAAAIQQKPGGSVVAQGFLKGELRLKMTPAEGDSKSKQAGASSPDRYNFDVQGQNFSLKELKDLLGLSLPLKGQINLSTQGVADIRFIEQPEGDITLIINQFDMASSSLSMGDLGRVNLPEIKLGQVELKGKLSNGKFVIETGKIGTTKDAFYGEIKGDLGLTIQNMGGQIVPLIGAYDISLDLKATAAFREKATLFLSFLDGYKKELTDGTQYKFNIQASAMGAPPQITSPK